MTTRTEQLTPFEYELVSNHRKREAEKKRAADFQSKAIELAAKTFKWQKKEGIWMQFNDFVTGFGYEKDDARPMYEAIRRIWDAAKLLEEE